MTLEAYFGTQYPSGGHTLLGGAGRTRGRGPDLALPAVPVAAARLLRADPLLPRAGGRRCRASSPRRGRCSPRSRRSSTRTPRWAPSRSSPPCRSCCCSEPCSCCCRGCSRSARAARSCPAVVGGGRNRRDRARVRPLARRGRPGRDSCCCSWSLATGARSGGRCSAGRRCSAVAIVVLALPTFGPLSDSLRLTESFSTSNVGAVNDPGNLLRPLKKEQMLGVWLTGGHRGDPVNWFQETYVLIGVAPDRRAAGPPVHRAHPPLDAGGLGGGDGASSGPCSPSAGSHGPTRSCS